MEDFVPYFGLVELEKRPSHFTIKFTISVINPFLLIVF